MGPTKSNVYSCKAINFVGTVIVTKFITGRHLETLGIMKVVDVNYKMLWGFTKVVVSSYNCYVNLSGPL